MKDRQCNQLHPQYTLSNKNIEEQIKLLTKTIKVNQYDELMGNLYRIILQIQETQSFIEALHLIPQLAEGSINYRQQRYSKLKHYFQFRQIQDLTLLSLKNQNKLIFTISQSIDKAKEQINGFSEYFEQIKNIYLKQISFLKFDQELQKNKQNNESSKLIEIDDDEIFVEDDDQNDKILNQLNCKQNKHQSINNSQTQMINSQQYFINSQCTQNTLNDVQNEIFPNAYIELISSEEESEYQQKNNIKKKVTQHNVIINQQQRNRDISQKVQNINNTQTISISNKMINEEDCGDFEILQSQSNMADSDYVDENYQQNKIIKKKKVYKKKYQSLSRQEQKQEKNYINEDNLKQGMKLLQKEKRKYMKKKGFNQNDKKNQQLITLNQDEQLSTITKKYLVQDITVTNEENKEQNQNIIEQQIPLVKDVSLIKSDSNQSNSLKVSLQNKMESTTVTNQDIIIEEDDECEEEMEIIQKQNGQIEKVLITNFTWPRSSQSPKKSPDIIQSGRSSISNQSSKYSSDESQFQREINDNIQSIQVKDVKQISQQNQERDIYNQMNIIQDESEPYTIENRFNYYAQSKFIHFNQKKGLLLLNQKNVVLYTFQKPKVRKSRFEGLFENDSDIEQNENQEQICELNSEKQQSKNTKELYLKKVLFNNIKSAEVFEVYNSYYVLVMQETNGAITIVKSNNYYKWKLFYKSGESSTYQSSYIFNNSSNLYVLSFNTSHIKLFSIDLNTSKPNPKQLVSKIIQYNLTEGQFIISCQGFWQILKNSNQQVLIQNEIFFFIAQENQISLFKTDMNKIELIVQEEILKINSCKILNLCGQVSLVVLQDHQALIYNQLLKLTTKIQAHPDFGIIVDCFLPQEQGLSELSLIIVQEYCTFSYNCVKNKANLYKIPEKYNIAFFDQNQSKFMSLFESSNKTIEVDIILPNQ